MAARKLQTEIDRTLKKVSEGVELFDSIYDKMQASTNQTQKEKLELDLKSQIKKLQRLRDQIKTWVSASEIKDKSQLLENRKIIETQMEKFKACEKEMKTKAFSKDGLIAAMKLDPKEKEKGETSAWLTAQVDELSRQIEQSEAEVELLQAGGTKKRGKGGNLSTRLEELATLNERRKWHIGRLEIVLRLLENNSLDSERVVELKEHISYFVESNTEEDFEEDDAIYDDLNLDEQDAAFGKVTGEDEDESGAETDEPPPTRSPVKEKKSAREDPKKDESHSPVLRKAVPVRKATLDSSKVPPPILPPAPNFAAQPMSQALKSGLPLSGAPGTAGSKPALPPIRYAAAVANSSTNGASGSATAGPSTPATTNGHSAASIPPIPAAAAPSAAASTPAVVAPTPALSSSASIAAQESASTPPSPSITSSPVASSIAPPSSIQQPDSSAYFDSRQQSPVLSNPVDRSVSAASPNVSTSVVSGSSYPANQSQQTSNTSISQAAASSTAPSSESRPTQLPAAPQVAAPSPLPQQVQFNQQQPTGLHQQYQNSLDVPSTSNGSSPLATSAPQSATAQHPPYPPGVLPAPPTQQQQSQQQQQQQTLSQSVPQQQQGFPQQQQQSQLPQQPVSRPTALPSSLADLVASFESAKQKAPTRMGNLNQVHKVLEAGFSGLPQPRDTEKPKYYVPRNPFITPAYYPQQPLASLDSPGLYARLDPETLFYIFYYHAGTYQQYLAASELKRQSWRFHTKYLTWFQRHSEPQAITDEYEQGVYVYFDWEGSWCQRKKSDFRFEYRYLSED